MTALLELKDLNQRINSKHLDLLENRTATGKVVQVFLQVSMFQFRAYITMTELLSFDISRHRIKDSL